MQTCFNVDFKITAAVPLSDSVLIFHENGLRGLSFFNSSIVTQELNDPMKIYDLLGSDKMIVLRCRSLIPRSIRVANKALPSNSRLSSLASIVSKNSSDEKLPDPIDVAVLIGHVETILTP
jgi:hypothetical protein